MLGIVNLHRLVYTGVKITRGVIMKKLLPLILSLVFCISLIGCSASDENASSSAPAPTDDPVSWESKTAAEKTEHLFNKGDESSSSVIESEPVEVVAQPTASPTPEPTPEPTVEPSPVVEDEIEEVLVTPTGKRYHRYECGSGNYSWTTLDKALGRGLTPCKNCYG